jgi:hypothetical protein
MSDEQPVGWCSTDLDDCFNAFYERALASTLLSKLFTQSELEQIFANASRWLKSRGRAVQFLLGSFDEQLRHDELAWPVRDRFRGFFVGREAARKFGGSRIVTGGK